MNESGSALELPEPQLSSNARVVLERRYLRKDPEGNPIEDPKQMFWRIAESIAKEEGKYERSPFSRDSLAREFYALMAEFDFLPNSPTLMNAGSGLGQLAACFVLPVGDSMEEIFDAIKHAALIHKSGGGTGFSFSRLRPKESRVGSTGGVASGPISFLKIFNTATEQVKQGGTRRGANMGVLRVDHPDILEFIKAKEREGRLNNFNLSVALTEPFMQAVEEDTEYSLIAPHTGLEEARLKAREVFHLLVQKAWERGDPGIIFIDRINRDNPTPEQGEIESTNPCIPADTWVHTSLGPRQVKDLIGEPVSLLVNGREKETTEHGFFSTGTKRVLRLNTAEGYSLRLTSDHQVLRAGSLTRSSLQSEWVQASSLTPGDKIVLHNHRCLIHWPGALSEAEGYLLGLLVGDGTLKEDKAVLSVWQPAEAANGEEAASSSATELMQAAQCYAASLPHRKDFQGWQKVDGRGEYRLSLGHLKKLANRLGMGPGRKEITPELEKTSSDCHKGFLRGLFDADGSVQGSQMRGVSIRLAQSSWSRLEAAQRMLLRLGIASTIHTKRRAAASRDLPDGRGGLRPYACRDQHELIIAKDNIAQFAECVGFHDSAKTAKLQAALSAYRRHINQERFVCTFQGLEDQGLEEVYDVQVPEGHAFDANGLTVHNCGEQPLLPYEACNLGSVNLARFFEPQSEDGVDWDRLKRVIHLSIRFLDNVIDASSYPLEQITQKVHRNRKVGLGIMGWADLLFQLNVAYDSHPALDLASKVMDFFQQESKAASQQLAEERGPFSAYPESVFAAKRLGPYRNATTTTIAPTGTLSILAGCSSGIEPLYALSFERRVMDGERLVEVNHHFEKALLEAGFSSPDLKQKIASKGTIKQMEDLPESLRRVFVTALDIEPEWHLRMQAAFQRHTDNAVSKTVNLPNEATQEDILNIYWQAYEHGCKGVTVFRDGCQKEQVLSTSQSESPDQERPKQDRAAVRERPEVVYGFTQKVKTGLGTLYLTVNEVDGKPFEVFATIGRSGRSITAKAEAIGRLVSLALRSGIPVEDVVRQLKGIGGEHPVFQKKGLLLSIPDAVAWVLQNRYLQGSGPNPDSHSLGRAKCPECGLDLVFQEGCFICHSCGFTKCG